MSTAEVIALYSCPKCNKNVVPTRQLRPSSAGSDTFIVGDTVGFVNCCPHCHGGVVVCDGRTGFEPAHGRVATPAKRGPTTNATSPTDDVLGMAKRRLEYVREQIAALKKFEAEEAMLERMVWAAEAE